MNGSRIEMRLNSEDGVSFGGYMPPEFAASFGRSLIELASDALAEMRQKREKNGVVR